MFDYQLLEALDAIITTGSFHKAAKALHISQSAVSQRILLLEEQLGSPVLVRRTPPLLTRIGIQLINHLRDVRLREHALDIRPVKDNGTQWGEITIGVNADSAATWFFDAIKDELIERKLLLKLLVETGPLTHDLLLRGEVMGCITQNNKPLPGCDLVYVGAITYTCVCTHEFKKRWFAKGFSKEQALVAPAVLFDSYDMVHADFLRKQFSVRDPKFPFHMVNSTEGFLNCILSGVGFGMIPKRQALPHLKSKKLIELAPHTTTELDFYWMYPRRGSQPFVDLWKRFIRTASEILKS